MMKKAIQIKKTAVLMIFFLLVTFADADTKSLFMKVDFTVIKQYDISTDLQVLFDDKKDNFYINKEDDLQEFPDEFDDDFFAMIKLSDEEIDRFIESSEDKKLYHALRNIYNRYKTIKMIDFLWLDKLPIDIAVDFLYAINVGYDLYVEFRILMTTYKIFYKKSEHTVYMASEY